MKIALCQLNPLVGDIEGNTSRLITTIEEHRTEHCDLFIFPELFLQGYPPRDLLEKQWFNRQSETALLKLVEYSRLVPETGFLFGTVLPSNRSHGKPLVNAAVLLSNGNILLQQQKTLLPTYDVFDETRYFEPSAAVAAVRFKGEILGISICEDAWNDPDHWQSRLYEREPVSELAAAGATLLINISASPFHMGKEQLRYTVMRNHARKHGLPLVFVNQIGGNDDLIFDGNSMVCGRDGSLQHILPAFEESVFITDLSVHGKTQPAPERDGIGSVHDALVLGVRDYVRKCGFSNVLLGLSGGIDSAVTAAIAARAVGKENVWGVTMPSRYSSDGSIGDSEQLTRHLGIRFSTIPIESSFTALLETLEPFFSGMPPSLAEENLQARIRGTILMGLSNKFNMLLLSTGNKSELAVGYSTLYGDMNGGMSVISDLPKMMVYQLAAYINRNGEVIPEATITKAPSAELRPDQKDQDSLPPYPVLDAILERLVERGRSLDEIIAEGYDPDTVTWVAQAIARNEYKRRQAPTGLKVTPKAFGSGRRFPIASSYTWS
ncbi:MAG: NAD+ synthase [Chitinispirillaceae bacterium]|nr:NAD+ synthase [Chitinispirillaceae bacterium]